MSAYSLPTKDVTPALELELSALAGNGGRDVVLVTESEGVTTYRGLPNPRLSLIKPLITLKPLYVLPRP